MAGCSESEDDPPVDEHAASKLDAREETFCIHILGGKSQTAAYRLAFQPKRAKPKTVHEKASRLMAKGKVRARLAELWAPVIANAQMSRTEWLERLTKCCRFDPRKMFDALGRPKKITELDVAKEAAAIVGLEIYGQGTGESRKAVRFGMKVKFIDRVGALALLGKACHYFADRQEQTGPDGGPIPQNLTVSFVNASMSPEEAYRRMVQGSNLGRRS